MPFPLPLRNYRGPFYFTVKALAPAATPTDIIAIPGLGDRIVVVRRIGVRATQTTGGSAEFRLIKRSAANTGGTSANMPRVPGDSDDTTGACQPISYTANPASLGTAIGDVRTEKIFVPGTTALGVIVDWDFRDFTGLPLHGIAESLCVNLDGVTLTGGSIDVELELLEGAITTVA